MKSSTKRRIDAEISSLLRVLTGLKRIFRLSVLMSIIAVLCIIGIAIMLFSPLFTIKNILPERTNASINIAEIQRVLEPYYGINMIRLQEKELINTLQTAYPYLQNISIKLVFPDTLAITYTLEEPVLRIKNDATSDVIMIGMSGTILPQRASEEYPEVLLKQYDSDMNIAKKLINTAYIKAVLEAIMYMNTEILVPIERLEYLYKAEELHIILPDNSKIMLDITIPTIEQLRKLTYKTGAFTLNNNEIEHIDLRIPHSMYYKKR